MLKKWNVTISREIVYAFMTFSQGIKLPGWYSVQLSSEHGLHQD